MSSPHDQLRLNVGFIIHQTVGYTRDFPIEVPHLHLYDLDLDNLQGGARVTRTAQGLLLQVKLSSLTQAECVRCLNGFLQPLEVNFIEVYAFTLNSVTESGLIVPESGKIDLEPIVREEMLVATPISPLCRPDCKGLCPQCGNNLNESTCFHEEEPPDPRLSVLKILLKDQHPPID